MDELGHAARPIDRGAHKPFPSGEVVDGKVLPKTVIVTKRGDTAFGRDARAGEHNYLARGAKPDGGKR
jgi:hypothetical protein